MAKDIAREPDGATTLHYPLQRLKRDLGRKGPKKRSVKTKQRANMPRR